MSYWLIFVLAVITFSNRYFFLMEYIRYTPGTKLKAFLSYSVYAVLTALWAPLVFQLVVNVDHGYSLQIAGLDYLLATITAAIFALLKFKSIFVVLGSTSLFFLLRYVVLPI